MHDEGALEVRLAAEGGVVARVDITSSRRTDLSRLLVGLPVDAALALVPSLFSICAAAQTVAGLEACEAALGLAADPGNRALRQALVALEALENHAFQFFVEWPRLRGAGPSVSTFRAWRAATEGVRRALLGEAAWALPGGVDLERAPAALATLAGVVAAFVPAAALVDEAAVRRWAADEPGFEAATGAGALAGARTSLVPLAGPAWFQARLGAPDFSARPTLDGQPAEAGAIALVAEAPLARALLDREGRTLFTRLVGRLLDVHRLLARLEALLSVAASARRTVDARRAEGTGAGIADTSRGRLAHAVEVRAGRVAAWRTVAPTEWSFHPGGVVAQTLQGVPLEAALRVAPFLVSALDPCVACRVRAE
jgi:coenzyme F420-reducing hydrogenase alpha subunit